MANFILFQMWEGFRKELLNKHEFYVGQAKKRLLSQFDDIRGEADRAADEWLEEKGPYFDPDRHDPADLYEGANDAGIEFYIMLSDMHDQTRLGVIAGFTHEWEKNLRQWLVDQVNCWHRGEGIKDRIWKANLDELFSLLESFGWELRSEPYFDDLEACRLVVNVHKHGDGPSLKSLAEKFPAYLEHPLKALKGELDEMWLTPKHSDLNLSDDDLELFSDAIGEFWQSVPADVSEEEFNDPPGWFAKALAKDRAQA